MRLDKYIADTTNLSRSEAGKVIKQGRITVDGKVVKKAAEKVPDGAKVTIDGDALEHREFVYIMMNKPVGVICSTKDSENETVLAFLDEDLKRLKPAAAGRLDKDVTGLVLLTNDGQWNHMVTSPRKDKNKLYHVIAENPLTQKDVERFKAGILLSGEEKACKPADLILTGEKSADLTISEGRYHQVKRMFEEIDNKVVALHRSQVAGITLDESLKPGEWRELTDDEINQVME